MRAIGDEIFGEDTFVDAVIWQKNYSPKPTVQQFSSDHDYILVYAKGGENWKPGLLPRTEQQDAAYKNPDNDPRGPWKAGDFSLRNYYSKGVYKIKTPGGRVIKGPPAGRYWATSEDNLWELDKDKRIWWGEDGNNVPSIKQFLSEVREGRVPQTLWFYHDVGHTQEAKKELFDVMGWDEGVDQPFTTPKPKRLIDRILAIACEKNGIVLDSFSGSGTTAHSVLGANSADGGTRTFIMVEVENYADSTTAERVRRNIKGVPKAKEESFRKGLRGSFTYCELGDSLDLDKFFDGKSAPNYEQVARYVIYTATGMSVSNVPKEPRRDWFVGEAGGYRIHLIYKPDLAFMRGNDAALTLPLAKEIAKGAKGKPVLVYAATKFMAQKQLTDAGITFCQLPYSVHRVLGEAPDAP